MFERCMRRAEPIVRPHFVQYLFSAHGLIFQRDCLLDSPFLYPVLYEFAVKMLNRAHQIFCSDEAK